MTSRSSRPDAWAPLALGLAVLAGCAAGEKPVVVKGTVTFHGSPVGEGLVQFTDERTGRGAEVELRADGGYEATLFAGGYKVVVTPPFIMDNSGGIPDPRYKKVKNIPARYHSTATSGLAADVSPDKTTHDFALAP